MELFPEHVYIDDGQEETLRRAFEGYRFCILDPRKKQDSIAWKVDGKGMFKNGFDGKLGILRCTCNLTKVVQRDCLLRMWQKNCDVVILHVLPYVYTTNGSRSEFEVVASHYDCDISYIWVIFSNSSWMGREAWFPCICSSNFFSAFRSFRFFLGAPPLGVKFWTSNSGDSTSPGISGTSAPQDRTWIGKKRIFHFWKTFFFG